MIFFSFSLQRVQDDLAMSTQREKETVDALRDSEDILSKRRAEIARMREQVRTDKSCLEQFGSCFPLTIY